MELSCKVDYACIALLELALRHKQGKPTSVSEIAISQRIPIRYLDQVMAMLRRAGIIKSQRGAKGGYHLAREPWQIKLTDVVIALDGEAAQEQKDSTLLTAEKSAVIDMWETAKVASFDILHKHTLEDLLRKCEEKRQSDVMFYI
ncbi:MULTISPECIES: RrF2 family transcriptional regulator [Pseudanabaena]|uniref:Transcriptional regulator, BadM/Rrf2 family n=2 Tax=Pseudanabaena TaxID=1152 RepID=L8N1B3_9CYAN|nr:MULTISPECIES: Rrf2 family transcriptional regulator [Pseudanabaena]ELS32048.1 transcriptional regulator, BadM/Rrf2 family [Pseudanabaena biceps PCC 7429]MDG3495698.1 Rrf2 family transcriptional regulator [Pseudanabaena catenata USMAC16]